MGISAREGGSRSRQRGTPSSASKAEPPELSLGEEGIRSLMHRLEFSSWGARVCS